MAITNVTIANHYGWNPPVGDVIFNDNDLSILIRQVFNDTTDIQFVVDEVHSALRADSLNSTHALCNDHVSPSEVRSMYSTISYAKGASILRMMEKSYGSAVFYAALRDYLKNG